MMGSILYILPAGGYSGGANSVVQEVSGFLRMGIAAAIAVDERNHASFVSAYASLPAVLSGLKVYGSQDELEALLADASIAVATIATSVPLVVQAYGNLPKEMRPKMFYYIQDYEPFFFEKDTENWENARRSYEFKTILRGFAKTDWICKTVEERHGMTVSRVKASIDHDVYFPLFSQPARSVLSIAAMIRPGTPRRAPRRTWRIINRLAAEMEGRVSIATFGCSTDELRDHGLTVAPSVRHHGRLTREQVAQVLRQSDLFLDLSDYQAFGRTGLEAAACGAVPLVTVHGGADEYVVHGENGFLVDVRDEQEILRQVRQFSEMSRESREMMGLNAMRKASEYTIHQACASILAVFRSE